MDDPSHSHFTPTDFFTVFLGSKNYEDSAKRQASLPDKLIAHLCHLSNEDPHGVKAIVWMFVAIGLFAGLRRQEYAMDKRDEIQNYRCPNRTLVMRAFAVEDFLFYDIDGAQLSLLPPNSAS